MIYVVNSGTTLSAAQINVLDSLVALGTTAAGSAITKDAGGNFVNTVISSGSGTVTSVSFTGGLISVATATTTPALTVAGTSGGIPYFSSASTWATSAALAANAIVIGGGAGVAPSTITTGTGVVTALGVNVGSAGAFVTFNGALGTPSSGTLTNCTFPTLNQNTTGSAASLSVSGQTGLITFTGLASTNRVKTVRDAADTILELGGSYTPTGTWTSMTLVTPALGTPASGVMTNVTGTATNLTSGITNALKSATTTVNVSSATAPTSGQVLTATSSTAATWQTPTGGGSYSYVTGGTGTGVNNISITGLGLDTAIKYKIFVTWYVASLSTGSDFEMTFNTDAASGNYAYAFNGFGRTSDTNAAYTGAGEAVNGIKICDAYGMGSVELTVWQYTDGTNESKMVMGNGWLSRPFATGQAREATTINLSGNWQDNANVTSIQFDITGSSDTANWEYRVYKIVNS